ncbi:MAG: NUDIX domain-containing protein [Treponema sp.]|nr:NUDIX domain-containing protein [Treponema sp.]
MKNNFNLCPMCGSRKIENHGNRKWLCPDCGFDLYCNVAAAVGIIIYDDDYNVLFEVRAKDPRKGYIAVPGGFVDFDESAENAVLRECREEIGVNISPQDVKFLCTNPNTYPYKNIEYKTCDIFFAAHLPAGFSSIKDFIASLKAQESEVAGFASYSVKTKEDVEKLPLAFESAQATLNSFVERIKAGGI